MCSRSIVAVMIAVTAVAGCSGRALDIPLAPSAVATTDLAAPPLPTGSPLDLGAGAPDLTAPPLSPPDLAPPPDFAPEPLCAQVTVSDFSGDDTGTQLDAPDGLAVDGNGFVYVADTFHYRVQKLAPDGTATTLAGNGTYGFADGTGGANGTAELYNPMGLAVDGNGNVYVGDQGNHRIRKIAPDGTTTTLAGNGISASVDGTGGPGGTAEIAWPYGLAVDGNGVVYVADYLAQRIRKIAPDGTTTTLAGNGTRGTVDGTGGFGGSTEFNGPTGVTVDGAGNVYVAELGGNRIRKIAPDGTTTTLAGDGIQGSVDGSGGPNGTAELQLPWALAYSAADNHVYVAEAYRIRRVAPDGTTITIAGYGAAGEEIGNGCVANFRDPTGIAVSGKTLYVSNIDRVEKIRLP